MPDLSIIVVVSQLQAQAIEAGLEAMARNLKCSAKAEMLWVLQNAPLPTQELVAAWQRQHGAGVSQRQFISLDEALDSAQAPWIALRCRQPTARRLAGRVV